MKDLSLSCVSQKSLNLVQRWCSDRSNQSFSDSPLTEEQLIAYRNLITTLLIYPYQAAKILSDNQQLIDPSLIQLLQQVSVKMAAAGNQEAANFLTDVLQQIHRDFLPAQETVINLPSASTLQLTRSSNSASKKYIWWWVLAIALAFGIGLTTYHFWFRTDARVNNATITPSELETASPVVTTVAGAGRIEPEGRIIRLSAPTSAEFNQRVAKLLVREGERVKAGQIVAVLDTEAQKQATLQKAKQQVKIAETNLERVKAGAATGEIDAQKAEIARLKAQLRGEANAQKAEVARFKAQLTSEVASQEAVISRLEAETNHAQTECQRYQHLYAQGAVTASEQELKCLQQVQLQQQLKEAQANRDRINNTLQEQLKEAQANLKLTEETLQEQLKEAQATLAKISQVRPEDIAVAQAELDSALSNVEEARASWVLAYVRSPQDSQILKIHVQPGEIIPQEGLMNLGRTEQMYAIAEIYETDIDRVRVNQTATITSDAFEGRLRGVVTEVGRQINRQNILQADPTADVDARVVEVKIRLNPEDSKRVTNLTNLQVKVAIDV